LSKKVIPRSKLIGMQVYNPDATLVGTIKDVGLIPGETGKIVLIVTTKYQRDIEIEWSSVAEVGDIVLLAEKVEITPPTAPAEAPAVETKICPTCGQPATWIEQYKRWYCYNCKKYL